MRRLFLPIALSTGMLWTACTASPDSNETDRQDTLTANAPAALRQEQGPEVGGAKMVLSKSIVENLMNSNDHTTFMAAVKAAGLAGTLRGAGPFTVFAPANEAFNKLPAGTMDDLLQTAKKKELTDMLTLHIISGVFKSSDLHEGTELKTIQGKTLKITREGAEWQINNARITIRDVLSENGIIHITDAVLIPGRQLPDQTGR